jgi:hypothetical protein
MNNELPDELLLRIVDHIVYATAHASPEQRGPLMRAMAGTSGQMTANVHRVGAQAFAYVRGALDDGRSISMEIPGDAIGVFVLNGELVW